jgi:hypothetical protein
MASDVRGPLVRGTGIESVAACQTARTRVPLICYFGTLAVAWTLADLADVPVRPSGANAGASSGRQ